MDDLIYHLSQLPRRHLSRFAVQTVGHVNKTERMFLRSLAFFSVNFSFLLNGRGSYQVGDAPPLAVRAPCVLTQIPGCRYSYGPGAGQRWRELFFIFPERTLPVWKELKLLDPEQHCWSLGGMPAVDARIDSLLLALEHREEQGMADVIDRLCELLIVESRRLSAPGSPSPLHVRLRALREEIDRRPERDVDFHRLARSCGCSYAVLRRDWKRLFGKAPGQYLTDRRMREARRLLVETRMAVGDIAYRLGFEDPLYFSRRFHRHTGHTASAYRRLHEPPLSSAPC